MTDARLPDRFLNDRRLQRLSAESYRAFVNALMWSVSNRTDGVVLPDDLDLIPGFPAAAAPTLTASGLWKERKAGGWVIADFRSTQTSRSQLETLENYRRREREQKARHRARKAAGEANASDIDECGGSAEPPPHPDESPDVQGDSPPGRPRIGQDRDRTGTGSGDHVEIGSGDEDWPRWLGEGSDPFDEYR